MGISEHMNKTRLWLVTLIIYFLISKSSFALSKLGHQVVCQLAFNHLSHNQQIKITNLLVNIPKNHQDLINHYNHRKKGADITFANACTWADAIKRIEKFRIFAQWHYMNVPRDQLKINLNTCLKNCLPQAIIQHQQSLHKSLYQSTSPQIKPNKNTVNTKWQQTQSLLFLSHWLGDIHQPLHISFASDLGGNKIKLKKSATKCRNLHGYWDQCILYRGKQSKNQWLHLLTTKWDDVPIPNWQKEQVWQWADESFQLVKQPSFQYCHLDEQGACLKPSGKITLSKNYLTRYQPVIEQRLLLAAKRLTKILEATL